jgi:hypothetical protein
MEILRWQGAGAPFSGDDRFSQPARGARSVAARRPFARVHAGLKPGTRKTQPLRMRHAAERTKKRRAYIRPGVFKLAGVLRRRLALSHKWRVKVTEE